MWSCSSGTITFYVDGTARISNIAASTWGVPIYGMMFGNWYADAVNTYPADHYVKNLRVTYGQALTAASPLLLMAGEHNRLVFTNLALKPAFIMFLLNQMKMEVPPPIR